MLDLYYYCILAYIFFDGWKTILVRGDLQLEKKYYLVLIFAMKSIKISFAKAHLILSPYISRT